VKGNPSGLLLSTQADLAERTLRAEIEEYHPALIIFVAGSDPCMSRIILRALNLGPNQAGWSISERVSVKLASLTCGGKTRRLLSYGRSIPSGSIAM